MPRARCSRSSTCALGIFVVGLLGACGSSASTALGDFDEAVQRASCERLARCSLFPDVASCLSYFRLPLNVSIPAAVDAGKARYDAEQASDCIERAAQRSCDLTSGDLRAQVGSCGRVFAGTLPGGTACSLDAECASGTCTFPADCPESGCCTGACREVAAPGAAGAGCAKDRDCQGNLVCAKDKLCRSIGGAGDDCAADRECGDGLACIDPKPMMPGTCRPLPHLGEECPYLRCADEGLRCDSSGTHRCVALGLPGSPCASGADCSPYMECNPETRMCQATPSLGEPCTANCQGASYCLLDAGGNGTCVAPKENGAACESVNECASYYCFVGPVFDSCTDPPVCI